MALEDLCNDPDDIDVDEPDECEPIAHCKLCGGQVDLTTRREGVVIDGSKPLNGEPMPPQFVFCIDCALHIAQSVEQTLRDQDICEHGIICGDWCEPCNAEYKRARLENGDAP